MTTIEEKLNDRINELEGKLHEYEIDAEDAEYEEQWRWRHLRDLTDEENLNLPLPRLEIRYRKTTKYSAIVDYGLVNCHLMGNIQFIPFSSVEMSGSGVLKEGSLQKPWRMGGDAYNDMWEMKLPCYVVNGKYFEELDLNDRDNLPGALVGKMNKEES